jgi:hypothetical protein
MSVGTGIQGIDGEGNVWTHCWRNAEGEGSQDRHRSLVKHLGRWLGNKCGADHIDTETASRPQQSTPSRPPLFCTPG